MKPVNITSTLELLNKISLGVFAEKMVVLFTSLDENLTILFNILILISYYSLDRVISSENFISIIKAGFKDD